MTTTRIDAPALVAEPVLWLGAKSSGGMALPDPRPTPSQFYAPRGVYLDDDCLVVADSGNHRVLVWWGWPVREGQPADVVLGQPGFYDEGPKRLHLPTGVLVHEGRLLVADAWHHRVLVWERVPQRDDESPSYAIGQASLDDVEPNRGGTVNANTLYWPYGLAMIAGWFYVADTGNRRVLVWRGLPDSDRPADLVLGQPDARSREENRGGPVSACSFRWPHALAGDDHVVYVADAGNHRVLGWSPLQADGPADVVLGQPDFQSAYEFPHDQQGAGRLRFPYGVSQFEGRLVVADTANNRVLIWQRLPTAGCAQPADGVLGQRDFDANGENRWQAVAYDTLCWPYGVWLHRRWLVIADSGNNRVMVWRFEN